MFSMSFFCKNALSQPVPIELEMLLTLFLEHMRIHGGLGGCMPWSNGHTYGYWGIMHGDL